MRVRRVFVQPDADIGDPEREPRPDRPDAPCTRIRPRRNRRRSQLRRHLSRPLRSERESVRDRAVHMARESHRRRACRRCVRQVVARGRLRPQIRRRRAASVATSAAALGPAATVRRRPPGFDGVDERQSASSIVLSPRGATEASQRVVARRASRRPQRSVGCAVSQRRAPSARQRGTPEHAGRAAGLGGPLLAGGDRHRRARRRPDGRGRGPRAADYPFTIPRPWSPSPATASMRPLLLGLVDSAAIASTPCTATAAPWGRHRRTLEANAARGRARRRQRRHRLARRRRALR